VCVFVCMYVCVYVCMHVCIYQLTLDENLNYLLYKISCLCEEFKFTEPSPSIDVHRCFPEWKIDVKSKRLL
jgi:hypothetical protein